MTVTPRKSRTSSPRPSGPSIGLALGGGAARGIAHIPLLEVLDEIGLRPQVIAGTSIGAIVGAAYASGMSGKEMRKFAAKLFGNRTELIKRMATRWPGSLASLWNPFTPAMLNGETLLEILLPETLPKTFAELQIPFRAIATDIYAHTEVILSEGPLLPAIAASASVPALLKPVQLGKRVLVDGGCVNPTPFDVARKETDMVIAFDLTLESPTAGDSAPNSLDSLMISAQIMFATIVREKLRAERPDVLIRPPVGRFRALNFYKVEEILAAGDAARDDLKRQLELHLG